MKFKAGDLVELKGHISTIVGRIDQPPVRWATTFFDTHAIITQVEAPGLIKIILPDGQNFWMRASKAKLAFDERSQAA